MANEPNYPEEEYHFSEPESSADYSEAIAASKEKAATRSKLNLLWMFIVIAALLFTIYKLGENLFFSHKKPITTPVKTITAPPRPVPAATTLPVITAPPAPVAAPEPVVPPVLNQRMDSLEQQVNTNQAAIDKLSGQISDIQNVLTNLTTQVVNMGHGLQEISEKMAAREAAAAERARRRTVVHRRLAPVYFVTAMVQGRAWLRTAGGRTITVKVGDAVPGYGTVRIIDPHEGILTMSSGAIIGYSPDDS